MVKQRAKRTSHSCAKNVAILTMSLTVGDVDGLHVCKLFDIEWPHLEVGRAHVEGHVLLVRGLRGVQAHLRPPRVLRGHPHALLGDRVGLLNTCDENEGKVLGGVEDETVLKGY